ncbi:MAG: DUF192 domain-containing protein [Burkholderiaceae bacterium]|nr:DUF192 domain-containing protein [Burkholderiaceae bacterium]
MSAAVRAGHRQRSAGERARGAPPCLAPARGASFALLGVRGRATTIAVDVAGRFGERLFGWLGRTQAPRERGLWITPCASVHTFGMRFPIDLVFVDRAGTIVRIDREVAPWRARRCTEAKGVIELPAGRAADLRLARGLHFELRR